MFGPEILGADGALDRPRLAQIIFSDPAAREWLNALCHPPIIAEVSRNIAALRAETPPPEVVVVVAPLLFEAKAESLVEKVVVVTATEQERVRRLQERDKVSEEEIRARFAAQLHEEEKQSRAAWVIDTTAGLEDTEHQVEVLWQELVAPRP